MSSLVGLVVTEHPDRLDASARARYARAGRVLSREAGGDCSTSHYLDPLPDADTLVLSGSLAPWAMHDPGALDDLGARVTAADRPTLGICAGMQLLARFAGGTIAPMENGIGEDGFVTVDVLPETGALAGLPPHMCVFQQHTDEVRDLPDELELLATGAECHVQAFVSWRRPWWGTQFHPERYEAGRPDGRGLLAAFFAMARAPRYAR